MIHDQIEIQIVQDSGIFSIVSYKIIHLFCSLFILCLYFHSFRMILVIALNVTSFLLIANTEAEYLAIIGVVCTSLALGIGEVTLLSYSAQYNK